MRLRTTISLIAALAVFGALGASCTQMPPAEFLTPEFEEVVVDDTYPDGIRLVCKMSSMAQLTEYGLDYTDDFDSPSPKWIRVEGNKSGDATFDIVLTGLESCTTYCYRLYIGNGRDILQSAPNYFTTPE